MRVARVGSCMGWQRVTHVVLCVVMFVGYEVCGWSFVCCRWVLHGSVGPSKRWVFAFFGFVGGAGFGRDVYGSVWEWGCEFL